MSKYLEKAKEFRAVTQPHYNCAQSVLCSFTELTGLSQEESYRIASNFGAGMRTGSVCGAVTGALMTLGMLGFDDPAVPKQFCGKICEKHDGCLNCKDLLLLNKQSGKPKKQFCDEMVYEAVQLVEEKIKEKGLA